MEREKILELVNLVLDIREIHDSGIPGIPYAKVEISSIGTQATFYIMDAGFRRGAPSYDKMYEFGSLRGCDLKTYTECKKHLERLREKAERTIESCGKGGTLCMQKRSMLR